MMNTIILFNFTGDSDLSKWQVVNDGVMGGRSSGEFKLSNAGHGVFEGTISLENNGGFSSIRYSMEQTHISGAKTLVLHIKGDGKKYQFRLKPNTADYYNYVAYFETSGKWETIKIPLETFYPNFRGRALNAPNFNQEVLDEIGILIGNKKAEQFRLEIDQIELE